MKTAVPFCRWNPVRREVCPGCVAGRAEELEEAGPLFVRISAGRNKGSCSSSAVVVVVVVVVLTVV